MKDLTNFEKPHYIALSLFDGKPILQLEFGFSVGNVFFPNEAGMKSLSDGEWHTIEVTRTKQVRIRPQK